MIHVNSIANALYTMLSSDSTLVNSGFFVDLNEPLNTDPNRVPWVGIYADDIDISGARLGAGGGAQPYDAIVELEIYVQQIAAGGAQYVNDLLYRAQDPVISAVYSDRTLGGTVRHIDDITVSPFQRDIVAQDFTFTNVITLLAMLQLPND